MKYRGAFRRIERRRRIARFVFRFVFRRIFSRTRGPVSDFSSPGLTAEVALSS